MLIHITPQFITCAHSGPDVALVDLNIEPLGVLLRGDVDITARRPYRNKRYTVGCRRAGRKAIAGILIDTPAPVAHFTVVTRWAIRAEIVVTHSVRYEVLDTELDTVSDNMVLWYGTGGHGEAAWPSRWPEVHQGAIPARAQPRMQLTPDPARTGCYEDHLLDGLIAKRSEVFPLPTIGRERLFSPMWNRDMPFPPIEAAFRIA